MSDRSEAQGAHFGKMLNKIQSDYPKIELTDEEWMSIIARDRDGLPACCGNISSLRDVLISIARDDGELGFLNTTQFCRALTWCFPNHEVPPVVQKVLDQIGWEMFEFHEPDKGELR